MLPIGSCALLNPKIDKKEICDDKLVHFVPMPAVTAKTNEIDVSQTRKFLEVKKGYTAFTSGDVLFAKITPCMENGKMCLVPDLEHGLALGSTEFHVLRASDALTPEWLYYYVSSDYFRYEAEHNMTGAVGQRRVPIKFIGNHEFPLPPLNEQKCIVAKIEELFSEIDAGEQSLRDARKQLTLYRQSLLKQAFEGKLTETWRANNPDKLEDPKTLLARIQQEREARHQQQLQDWQQAVDEWEQNGQEGKKPAKPRAPKYSDSDRNFEEVDHHINGWIQIRFGNLACSIRGGTTAVPKDQITEIPILRSSSVRSATINYSDVRYLTSHQLFSSTDYVQMHDLLFTRLNGTVEYVGNCVAIKKESPNNLVYPDRLYCAKLPNIAFPPYIEAAFQTPSVRAFLEDRAKSTAGHKRISISDLEDVSLPLMCYSEQQEIVHILDEQFTAIDLNEKEIDHSLTQSKALRQSILKKAFEGELL
jgi:type I restriction enzyme S subunit